MLLNSLVTQSTYCVILCLPCVILKSFLRREKTFAQKKLYVILKIIPSEIYIRNLVEFCIMAHGEKKKFLFTDIYFLTEESTLLFRIAKSFYATNSYTTYFLQMTKSLGKSKRWIDFPWCNIFEMRSERKCSVFDLLWPDPSILEGESEKFVFLENKTCLRKKDAQTFLSY